MVDHTTPFKMCSGCKQQFPRTNEYFHNNKAAPDKLTYKCKDCASASTRSYYVPKVQHTVELPPNTKACGHCSTLKPVSAFHRDKYKPDGYQSNCKECHKSMNQNWLENNREYYLDQKRAWRKANPDKVKAHKNASQKRHRSAANARSKRWRENNHETMMMYVHRRIAYRNSVPEDYTVADWEYALEYFNHSCAVCGRPAGFWHTIAKDHWIALRSPDCPGTIPSNIVPLCHTLKDGEGACNNSKGKRSALEWLSSIYPPKQVKAILASIETYFATVRK